MSVRSSCGIAEVILYFEETEMAIAPFELDVYKDEGKLDHARVRISREAGELIDDRAKPREPVTIWSQENKITRLFFPDYGLELGTNDAHIELLDELQILEHVEVEKTFSGSWKVKDVIDYIFNLLGEEDEYGLINEWKESETNIEDLNARTIDGSLGIVSAIPYAGDFVESIRSGIRNSTNILEDDADFDFSDSTGLEALSEISDEFQINFFTKDDGVMYVGYEDDDIEAYVGSFTPQSHNLINYSVPGGNNKIKDIIVKGETTFDTDRPVWDIISGETLIETRGYARRTDIDEGDTLVVETDSFNINVLSQVAESVLRDRVEATESGSATVDVLSTDLDRLEGPEIKTISIGDLLIVPGHDGRCRNIVEGVYLIDSINHTMNRTKGWTIQLGLKRTIYNEVDSGAYELNTSSGEIESTLLGQYDLMQEFDDGIINDIEDELEEE